VELVSSMVSRTQSTRRMTSLLRGYPIYPTKPRTEQTNCCYDRFG
jgi:hypothetical protein